MWDKSLLLGSSLRIFNHFLIGLQVRVLQAGRWFLDRSNVKKLFEDLDSNLLD